MRKRLRILLILFFLSACVPLGRDFPSFPVEKIRANETTKDQVYAAFGEPVEKGSDSGYETWTYYHYIYSVTGQQTGKRLHISFNTNGTVRTYSFSSN
jgi:hypothetical protein